MTIARVALLCLFVAGPLFGQAGPAGFPHDRHGRLFPTCEGCHAGVMSGTVAALYPAEASCRECHNGTDARLVTWRPPSPVVGLLRFSHVAHAGEVDSTARQCATCHAAADARRMDVRPAAPASCFGCHTHRATAHFADDNRCATCHVALTEASGLTAERVARLPRPPSHDQADFVSRHAPAPTAPLAAATCAVCHARESCARCHVNASSQPMIAALGRDARVAAAIAGKAAAYPTPADHRGSYFAWRHGESARAPAGAERCGTCHARPSCLTCHIGTGGTDLVRRLPTAERGGAPGVRLIARPPRNRRDPPLPRPAPAVARDTAPAQGEVHVVQVHDAGFGAAHGTQAAAGTLTCAGCHAQRFCSDCHAGEGRRRFHGANFTVRHAADAYGRETDCASCHNTETFCKACHQQSGLSSRGRLNVAYHTAQPVWLLQHGRAARQGLQNCASCHAQRDCLTCHSTVGWGVNPHGRGFDADRMGRNAGTTCLVCHLEVPRGRSTP